MSCSIFHKWSVMSQMAPATLRDILKDLDTTRRKSHAYLVTFLEQSLSRSLSSQGAKEKARLLAKGLHKRFTGKVWSKESFINFLNSPKEEAYLGQVVLEDDAAIELGGEDGPDLLPEVQDLNAVQPVLE